MKQAGKVRRLRQRKFFWGFVSCFFIVFVSVRKFISLETQASTRIPARYVESEFAGNPGIYGNRAEF